MKKVLTSQWVSVDTFLLFGRISVLIKSGDGKTIRGVLREVLVIVIISFVA